MFSFCVQDDCARFQQFPPGHFYSSKTGEFTRYYNPKFLTDFEASPQRFPSTPLDLVALRVAFESAVEKRMMSDVPFGERLRQKLGIPCMYAWVGEIGVCLGHQQEGSGI